LGSALPASQQPGDATNYLGGIAHALEVERHRIKTSGSLDHLGYLKEVGLYDNDSQIKEVRYREVESDRVGYTVTLRRYSIGSEGRPISRRATMRPACQPGARPPDGG
jgi:hypothetical protein